MCVSGCSCVWLCVETRQVAHLRYVASMLPQSSMRDLIKSYEKRRRHAKRCTTCGMCGCRLKCCACWAYTWQCRWLPTRFQPAAAAPPLPSPRRRGSFNFHARQQAARQSPPPPKPSCCTRTARGCGRRLRACLWILTCGMCGGVGSARGSTSAKAAAAGKSSSSRPPTVLQWDAGVSTFSALQQLVTTMVTTSVPDASGKDVDARAGKSSTDQSTPQADLYSTHLNLGARRNEGQAPRRGTAVHTVLPPPVQCFVCCRKLRAPHSLDWC